MRNSELRQQTNQISPEREKYFLLGVGAQRAGTSWLHYAINTQQDCSLEPCKEFHIWDAISCPAFSRFKVSGSLLRPDLLYRSRSPGFAIRRRMQRDPEHYFNHFHGQLQKENVRFAADITPSYSGLSASTFKKIHAGFSDRGITVRVVFIIRDPVHRALSAIALNQRRLLRREKVPFSKTVQSWVKDYLRDPATDLRSRYERTIERLHVSFQNSQICLAIFEKLLGAGNDKHLQQFLETNWSRSINLRKINSAPPCISVDEELKYIIAKHYEETYLACGVMFPELKMLWSGFRYL